MLAAVGYVPAAAALIYPAMLSLFVVGLLLVLQELVSDIYAAVTRAEPDAGEALYRQGSIHGSYFHAWFPSNPLAVARLLGGVAA